MSKRICVYTCITGDYDKLHEIDNPEKNVDYLCFTNNPNLKSKTWKLIPIKDSNLDNHYLSRKIKMLGHPIISENYDISVWMDGAVIWQQSIANFVKKYLKEASFAAFKHSQRKSIHEEAIACLNFRKETKNNILDTLNFLDQEQFPDDLGLYEMTVFIKRHNDPKVIKTMNIWFETILNHSKRDQLSFMYAIWKTHLKINTINLNVWNNPWFYSSKHLSPTRITDCHIYYGNPDEDFNFNKYYIYNYQKKDAQTYQINTTIPNDTSEIEINLTNSIGISCQNIIFRPVYDHLLFFGSIEYHNKIAFCIGRSTIKFYGSFKKGQKLFFSIEMKAMDQSSLQELAEQCWIQNNNLNNQNKNLTITNNNLKTIISDQQNQLHAILNSKSWHLVSKLQRAKSIIFPKKNK